MLQSSEAPQPAQEPEQPARGFRIEHNRDGSTVLKLSASVKVGGEKVDRLFIPALTGRHMRRAQWSLSEGASVGDLVTFAAEVVEPVGAVDELPAWVARNVGVEVANALGKSRAGAGEPPSSS